MSDTLQEIYQIDQNAKHAITAFNYFYKKNIVMGENIFPTLSQPTLYRWWESPFIYLFVYLFIYLFIYLFVCLFVCLFIYLFIYKQYLYRLSDSAQAGLNGGLCTR